MEEVATRKVDSGAWPSQEAHPSVGLFLIYFTLSLHTRIDIMFVQYCYNVLSIAALTRRK